MPTRKQKENAIAGKFPPNAKRGRGANRILFMTGALADLIGVPHYDTVKVSELTDEQIDLLYNRLYNKTAGSLRSLEARIARLEESQKRASIDPFLSVKHGIISALGGLKKLQKFIGAKVRDLGLRGKGVRIHFRLDHNAFRPYNMVEICLNDSGLYDMNFRRETHNRGRDVSYSDKVDNVPEGALSKTFERMTGLKLSRANRSLLPMRVALEDKKAARDPMMVLSEKIEREGKKAKSAIFSVSFETDRSMGLGQVRLILRYKFLTDLAQLPSDKAQEARGEVSKLYEYAETLIGKTYGKINYELEDWNTSAIQWIIDEG